MTLSQLFKYAYPFTDFLYLLQLEEYDTKRYFSLLPRFYERRSIQKRGSLIMTGRIRTIFIISAPLSLIFPPLLPIFVGFANALLQPSFQIAHWVIRQKATAYFKTHGSQTQVIAIAGSFGKTTTRKYIYELLRYNYRVQTTPGNINTPTGIASWILHSFKPSTEILIIEVDPYFKGEIAQSLRILPPDVAVLTNVGDQHLARFESQSELSQALHEVFEFAKKGALHIKGTGDNSVAAMAVAHHYKIPDDIITDTLQKVQLPDRRGNVVTVHGFEVIDQSYNISEKTALQAISSAKKRSEEEKKKLIVITAGIPELGKENAHAHSNVGKFLNSHADVVVLLRSIFFSELSAQIGEDKIKKAHSMDEAWNITMTFDPEEYIILQLPELTDVYY
ncbi:hypothetical protein KBD81_05805 [Candidatus Woesebacteria bacterium]|nr:hypothetical protein [Candidatus Woesebacteria bacterium]